MSEVPLHSFLTTEVYGLQVSGNSGVGILGKHTSLTKVNLLPGMLNVSSKVADPWYISLKGGGTGVDN